MIIWQAYKFFCETTSRMGNNAVTRLTLSAYLAIEPLKGESPEETDVFLPHEGCKSAIGLEPDFDKLTHMKRAGR